MIKESMKIVVDQARVRDINKLIKEEEAFGNSIDLYRFTVDTADRFIETVMNSLEGDTNEWTEVALQRAIVNDVITMKPFDINGLNWVEVDNYDDLAWLILSFPTGGRFLIQREPGLWIWMVPYIWVRERLRVLQRFIDSVFRKYPFYLYSNNSSRNKKQYVKKLSMHGIKVRKNILLSTDGLISSLKAKGVEKYFYWEQKLCTIG